MVLFGAGYDTRALRYRHKHEGKINFIEVVLPSVIEGKAKLYAKFRREQDPDWDLEKNGSKLIPFDLNGCGGDDPRSLIEILRTQGQLKKDIPTFMVWEAVLFYVNEDAVRNIMEDLFSFARRGGNGDDSRAETLLCFTGAPQRVQFLAIPRLAVYLTLSRFVPFFKKIHLSRLSMCHLLTRRENSSKIKNLTWSSTDRDGVVQSTSP